MFMKTFEEKWTAWIDGQLSGRELEEFEASLPDLAAARLEKENTKQLGTFLREHATAPFSNEEFFSHQLRERLDREDRPATIADDPIRVGWWSIRRLLLGGVTSLAIFVICAALLIKPHKPAADQSQYLSQILNARVDPAVSPNATISMFEKKEDRVTVLWVDGLQSLPAEYAAK
jgi:hypothetical protein